MSRFEYMEAQEVRALSDRELAEGLRSDHTSDGVRNFHLLVTEALARILIGRQWYSAVPADPPKSE